ncbi:hypothetical protein Tco_1331706 [Tanacetum coccineum]
MSSDSASSKEPDSPEAAPTSLDYVSGPEEPEQAPFSPDYVPGPEYPKYLALSDEDVLVEDQPYVVADSPIALSPGYVADSDPKEDSKDGPVDYPVNGGDGDDDESCDDDEEEEEASEEEEDEHLAPADSVVAPVVDHAPMPFPSEEEVERLLALPPPPPSPLISLSPPSAEERLARYLAVPALPSSPLPIVPHPYGSPNHVRAPPGFRAAMASLFIPPPVDHREDTPEAELPPRKRLCLTALTSSYEVGESSTVAPRPAGGYGIDYGFIGTLDAETRRQRAKEAGYGIRDEQDTQDVYAMIEDTQDRQTRLFQRVDGFVKDGKFHYETARLLDQEALVSREAWAHSVGLSSAVHYELQAYRTHTQMQDFRIASQESLVTTLITHVSSLQGHLLATLRQIQALQARGQTHVDDREGAGNST